MPPMGDMCRSIWWAVAAAGGAGLVAAVVTAIGLLSPVVATGAWLLVTAFLLLWGATRTPGGVRSALAFAGAGAIALLLGAVSFVLPSSEYNSSLVMVGLMCLVLGADCLAISRISAATRIPDGGLYAVAWVAILAGIGISSLPLLGWRATPLPLAGALAVTGGLMLVAARILRTFPLEPVPVSKREARRREKTGRDR